MQQFTSILTPPTILNNAGQISALRNVIPVKRTRDANNDEPAPSWKNRAPRLEAGQQRTISHTLPHRTQKYPPAIWNALNAVNTEQTPSSVPISNSKMSRHTLIMIIQEYLALEKKFGEDFEKGYYLASKVTKYEIPLMELLNEIETYKKTFKILPELSSERLKKLSHYIKYHNLEDPWKGADFSKKVDPTKDLLLRKCLENDETLASCLAECIQYMSRMIIKGEYKGVPLSFLSEYEIKLATDPECNIEKFTQEKNVAPESFRAAFQEYRLDCQKNPEYEEIMHQDIFAIL